MNELIYDDVINDQTEMLSNINGICYYIGTRETPHKDTKQYVFLLPRMFSTFHIDKLSYLVGCQQNFVWGCEHFAKNKKIEKLFFYTVIKRELLFDYPAVGTICCSMRSYSELGNEIPFFYGMLKDTKYIVNKKNIIPIDKNSILRLYDVLFNRFSFDTNDKMMRSIFVSIETMKKNMNTVYTYDIKYRDREMISEVLGWSTVRIPMEFKCMNQNINLEVGHFLGKGYSPSLSKFYSDLIHYSDFRKNELDYILGKTDIVPDKHFSNYEPV